MGVLIPVQILVLAVYLVSRKRGYRGLETRGYLKEVTIDLKDSIWAILESIIILGGIYTGIFTPTEAAVVAVFCNLILAIFIFCAISPRGMIRILSMPVSPVRSSCSSSCSQEFSYGPLR
jgi:C4-dicarboxylate transporter DctM subunit